MLHVLSNEKGWEHEAMMKMNKRVFYRYYGYWYRDRLKLEQDMKEDEIKNREKKWKTLP